MSDMRLRNAVRFSLLVIALLLFGLATGVDSAPNIGAQRIQGSANGPGLAQVVEQIVGQTNDFRKHQGRGEVKENAKLAETARYFADFMAGTDKYGHTADGKEPSDRAKKYGYEYCLIAENIAYQYSSAGFSTNQLAKGFFEGWKKSPGHRKNMLDPDVTETGVAIARSEKSGYYYAVQLFGRPRSEMIEFKITNRTASPVKYQIGAEKFQLPPRYTRTHEDCRSGELTLLPPEDDMESKKNAGPSTTPKNGDQFAVVQDESGKLKLVKE
jgi:uncharacterized protein YkwD